MPGESDEAVYLRFLAERREEDLIELLHRYEEGLRLFLYGYVRNLQDAEELTYDTFAALSSEKLAAERGQLQNLALRGGEEAGPHVPAEEPAPD